MLWHISQVADEGCRVGGHNAAGHGELDVIGMDGLIMKDRELTKKGAVGCCCCTTSSCDTPEDYIQS